MVSYIKVVLGMVSNLCNCFAVDIEMHGLTHMAMISILTVLFHIQFSLYRSQLNMSSSVRIVVCNILYSYIQ
jgi:hypothetical protein